MIQVAVQQIVAAAEVAKVAAAETEQLLRKSELELHSDTAKEQELQKQLGELQRKVQVRAQCNQQHACASTLAVHCRQLYERPINNTALADA